MFHIEKRYNDYDQILRWQKILTIFRIFNTALIILMLPVVVFGAYMFTKKLPDLLMLSFITSIILNIFGILLRELFKENNNRIIFSYLFCYSFIYVNSVELIHLLYDDKNAITPRIKYGLFSEDERSILKISDEPYSGMLLVQLSNDKKCLEFISMGFLGLKDHTYCTKKYVKFIRHDFGKLIIPIETIHYYEQIETQGCNLFLGKPPDQSRLTFVGIDALDRIIPEYKRINNY